MTYHNNSFSYRLDEYMKPENLPPFRLKWAWVFGYEGLYAISEYADIYSMKSMKTLKPRKTGNTNYFKVDLYKNGQRKTYNIHSLVYEAFHGKIPANHQIDHKNNNCEDNRLINLELLSVENHIKKHQTFQCVGISMKFPYRKEFNNVYEIEQNGFNCKKIKQSIQSGTSYNHYYWFDSSSIQD